jgi:hypothetical protein
VGRIRWGSADPAILTRRVVARWMEDDHLFVKTPLPADSY